MDTGLGRLRRSLLRFCAGLAVGLALALLVAFLADALIVARGTNGRLYVLLSERLVLPAVVAAVLAGILAAIHDARRAHR